MSPRNLRGYAVCRACSEIHPAQLGCPDCDGDERARFEMARARSTYVVPADPPVEGVRPKIRRLVHGTPTEPASVAWLRKHVAEVSVTVLLGTTLLLIALQLS